MKWKREKIPITFERPRWVVFKAIYPRVRQGGGGTGVKFYSSPSSFPGSCFFLPRGRKGEDPGNEVDESRNEEEIMATDLAGILKQKAKEAIDVYSSDLYDLNKRIWEKPELNFKETYAHEQLTKFMTEHGFNVTPHYTLDTAFRAECGEDGGLTIGLLSEYDALPVVGHACGHNLIAESGVAAALGKFSFTCTDCTVSLMKWAIRRQWSQTL